MKRIMILLALWAVPAYSQPPVVTPIVQPKPTGAPSDLAITGPEIAAVGQVVQLRLAGLPAVDATKVLSEELKWIQRLSMQAKGPKSCQPGDLQFDTSLAMSITPTFSWQMLINFTAHKPGTYDLVAVWAEKPTAEAPDKCVVGIAIHRIEVGGSLPKPPDPTPVPPQPVGQPWVVFVTNSKNPTSDPGQIAILKGTLVGQEFEKRKWLAPDGLPTLMQVDNSPVFGDNIDPNRKSWLESAVKAANAQAKFPVMVWCVGGSGEQHVEPLQKDEAAQLARILAIAGGQP